MLKEDTGRLPQKDAKRHKSQWKPERSLSHRQRETYPDIAARFLQYSKFLARYSSVPAAGKYRISRMHWTCVVQPVPTPPPKLSMDLDRTTDHLLGNLIFSRHDPSLCGPLRLGGLCVSSIRADMEHPGRASS